MTTLADYAALNQPRNTFTGTHDLTEIDAVAARVRAAYTGPDPKPADPAVTVPNGYTIAPFGDCWTVGPTGTGTRVIVDDLSQVPTEILAFDAIITRAAGIGAMR